MGCSHKKCTQIISATYLRNKKSFSSLVKEDILDIYLCLGCGAIRIDSRNEFIHSRGKWSERGADYGQLLQLERVVYGYNK